MFAVVSALVLMLVASSTAQIRFEDFSNISFATQFLRMNGNGASLATWQGNSVLRLTTGGADNPEASTVYFQDLTHAHGVGQQPVTMGFTTWFKFQAHSAQCCAPGDGFSFIVQQSTGTDSTYGASGSGVFALGAGAGTNQAGALGYAGINNNLVIEFDFLEDPWDPNSNHIAIQTCGPNTNTPVHTSGDFTIGTHQNVPNCLYQNALYTPPQTMGPICNGDTCMDGNTHDVVIGYTPPNPPMHPNGALQVWIDPTFIPTTHTPVGPPNIIVPYNIVYDAETNPNGLNLANGTAWVGFTASQPDDGTAVDIYGWEFTNSGPTMIQQVIQPGGTPTVFAFGSHQTTVTYPAGFTNPTGIVMGVLATPTDRVTFFQTRLLGTQFANEQCIAYLGITTPPQPNPPATCIVYTYSCQDSMGNPVTCPSESMCSPPAGNQCIAINTTFDTADNVTPTNADYLENDAMGSNNWMSIFLSFMTRPIDGTTSGGSRGFGGSGSSDTRKPAKRKFLTGSADTADIVATFRSNQP
jgi:hypothetical protein